MTSAEYVYTVLLRPRLLKNAANAVIKALLPKTVKLGIAEVCLNPRDPVISGALAFGVYEREEIALFRALFHAEMTFVDVGANVGLYTALALADKRGNGRILSLEPDPESAVFLRRTISKNRTQRGRIAEAIEVAAGASSGAAAMYKNPDNKGDNRLYADPLLKWSGIVQTRTLDSLCDDRRISSIEFIKIDVQGAEGGVIAGAARTLDQSADCVLMSEFWPYGLSKCGTEPIRYVTGLAALGFTLCKLRAGRLQLIRDFHALIHELEGRKYTNIVGLKGRFLKAGGLF